MEKSSNKVVFVMAIVIVLVVSLIAMLYVKKVRGNKLTDTNYDIKVYKSHEDLRTESGHSYGECEIDPSIKPLIISEFKKANSLSDNLATDRTQINGTYRIDYQDKIIAFDDDTNVVYVGGKDKLYKFDSPMYAKVIEACK